MTPFIRPAAVRLGDRLVARSVLFILLAFFTATMVTQPDIIDAEVEFQTVSSLARSRSFALGGTPEAEAITTVEHQGRQGFNVRRGGPGRELSQLLETDAAGLQRLIVLGARAIGTASLISAAVAAARLSRTRAM